MNAPHQKPDAPLKAAIIPVTPFQQNCSLIWCTATKRGAVVDPGGEIEQIEGVAREQGIVIEKILVTHGHLDHAGAVQAMREKLALPVEGPEEADRFWIDRMDEQGGRFGLAYARSFTPDRWLHDGDTVQVGAQSLDVIHCPGHTPGHVVFFHGPSRFAVVGDVLFRGSIGRSDFPKGNYDALVHSIRKKLFPLGDDVTFLPGHGQLSTFGWERKTNPFVCDLAMGVEPDARR